VFIYQPSIHPDMLGANPMLNWIIVNWILLMLFVTVGGVILGGIVMILRGT
jgi:hypothetical protein